MIQEEATGLLDYGHLQVDTIEYLMINLNPYLPATIRDKKFLLEIHFCYL